MTHDGTFAPLQALTRWKRCTYGLRNFADAARPLELYKLGSDYYVLDRHHRLAAALRHGQLAIEASVIEFVPTRQTAWCVAA
jgi:hypothetical protein